MPEVRLLLIEDDPDVAEMLVTYFDILQVEILHATDGSEGIALARAKAPTLILLDVMLPDMTGWDIARQLRSAALTRYIPIIFLTQRTERSAKLKGLGLGADDYITKPFDVEELRLRVRRAIQRATQERLYEPRTGLPGEPLIEAELKRLDGKQGWQRLDVHIQGLEAFRDHYGFLSADEAMAFAAKTLLAAVRQCGTADDFVGVTESDHFVVLTHTSQLEAFQKAMEEGFAAGVRALYNFQDAERGYLLLNPGTPQEQRVPLMTLSVERAG